MNYCYFSRVLIITNLSFCFLFDLGQKLSLLFLINKWFITFINNEISHIQQYMKSIDGHNAQQIRLVFQKWHRLANRSPMVQSAILFFEYSSSWSDIKIKVIIIMIWIITAIEYFVKFILIVINLISLNPCLFKLSYVLLVNPSLTGTYLIWWLSFFGRITSIWLCLVQKYLLES